LLAIASSLLLSGRSGLIKRNQPPADRPWADYGLTGVYITDKGTWTIARRQYADRQTRYVFEPEGAFTTSSGSTTYQGQDVSGGNTPHYTPAGNTVTVNPAPPYYAWMRSLRSTGGDARYLNDLPAQPPDTAPVDSSLFAPRSSVGQGASKDTTYLGEPSFIQVKIGNPASALRVAHVLPGHWFYDIYDDMSSVDGTLWLTSDNQRMLHRLQVIETDPEHPQIAVQASVPLPFEPTWHNCRIGVDPLREQLYILLADGRRYWFDPLNLELIESEQLPGVWEMEYASWSTRPGPYSPYLGSPLTKLQHDRILRSAMLVFLASLLGLALLWRPQWKSTSAATTADSSSSADSPPT
jgi:hypothetical protein